MNPGDVRVVGHIGEWRECLAVSLPPHRAAARWWERRCPVCDVPIHAMAMPLDGSFRAYHNPEGTSGESTQVAGWREMAETISRYPVTSVARAEAETLLLARADRWAMSLHSPSPPGPDQDILLSLRPVAGASPLP